MTTPVAESPLAGEQYRGASRPGAGDIAWKPIYRGGAIAALTSVGLIAVAVVAYLVSPPPSGVAAWFALFQRNALLGLLDLDLVMLVSYILMGLVYLALYGALRRASEPFTILATITGFVSITAYVASNPTFNMLVLSNRYAAATTEAQRAQLLAAGQVMLATWQGTAYDVSYVLGGVATLIIALIMLRSNIFGRSTAYAGVVLGVMMLVPATAGTVGLYLSLASLIPTAIWLMLVARDLSRQADR